MENKERNIETLKQLYKAMETGEVSGLGNFISKDMVEHSPDPFVKGTGLEYVKKMFSEYHKQFPDLKVEINQMVCEGDKIAVHATFSGTNLGDIMGKPATKHRVSIDGFDLLAFKDGKVTDHWGVTDNLSMMMQLGFVDAGEFAEVKK